MITEIFTAEFAHFIADSVEEMPISKNLKIKVLKGILFMVRNYKFELILIYNEWKEVITFINKGEGIPESVVKKIENSTTNKVIDLITNYSPIVFLLLTFMERFQWQSKNQN